MVNSLHIPRQQPVSPSVRWDDGRLVMYGELLSRWREGPRASSVKVAVFFTHRGPRLQGVLLVTTAQTGQMLPTRTKRALFFCHSSHKESCLSYKCMYEFQQP